MQLASRIAAFLGFGGPPVELGVLIVLLDPALLPQVGHPVVHGYLHPGKNLLCIMHLTAPHCQTRSVLKTISIFSLKSIYGRKKWITLNSSVPVRYEIKVIANLFASENSRNFSQNLLLTQPSLTMKLANDEILSFSFSRSTILYCKFKISIVNFV